MAIIPRPPHTGNEELDSVLTYIVNQLNEGVSQPGIGGGGGGAQGAPGTNGEDGNSSIYLYTRTAGESAVPTRPDNVTYNFENISNPIQVAGVNQGGWTPDLPTEGGNYLWVTFRYVAGDSGTITDANSWDTPSLIGRPGDPALVVTVDSFDPSGQTVGSDPTMWNPISRDFKNNEGDNKALVARVYRGTGEEWSTTEYQAATYRWRKNSQTTYVPQTTQRGDSGSSRRILVISATDVTDSGSDVFVCEVTF